MKAKQLPDTAAPPSSIWSKAPRARFAAKVASLERCTVTPGAPRVYAADDWPAAAAAAAAARRNAALELPFEVERQLADDFAFLGSYKEGVETVTAAAVEWGGAGGGCVVRVAANEGVDDIAQKALEDVLMILQRCAARESRDSCAEQCFDIIVHLHHNRILGRVGSVKYKSPLFKRAFQPKRAITLSLKDMLLRRSRKTLSLAHLQDLELLKGQIDALYEAVIALQSLEQSSIVGAIKPILKQIHTIATQDGTGFANRLQTLGLILEERNVRQIGKLANYWRISLNLAKAARSFRRVFSSIRLETVAAYRPSIRPPGSISSYHVHAEVQLLVFYETMASTDSNVVLAPRAIGVSKEACFLCNAFLRAYSLLAITKTHGKLFLKWTVPDLAEYGPETRQRLRDALAAVEVVIQSSLHLERSPGRVRRPEPNQSSINLFNPVYPAPSLSTLRSSPLSRSGAPSLTLVELSTPQIASLPGASPPRIVSPCLSDESSDSSTSTICGPVNRPVGGTELPAQPSRISISSAEQIATHSDDETPLPSTAIRQTITPSSPATVNANWLDLYLSIEPLPLQLSALTLTDDLDQVPAFDRGVVSVAAYEPNDKGLNPATHIIDLAGFAPGTSRVLKTDAGTGEETLCFVLQRDSGLDGLRVECRWDRRHRTSCNCTQSRLSILTDGCHSVAQLSRSVSETWHCYILVSTTVRFGTPASFSGEVKDL
ncbi:hypothetical protein MBLNU459_g0904t2 [Dothideomycetes sp. NU459]